LNCWIVEHGEKPTWEVPPQQMFARFIIEVEEEGVEGNWIPEWARARITGIDVNREERVARLQCVRGTGEWAVRRESLRDWRHNC
jgi:hypothetical protein